MPTDTPPGAVPPPGRRDLILQLLRTSTEPRSIASMADEMAVHPNTIRFHLDALVRTGHVEQVFGETTGPGRPPVLFRASIRMDPAGPTNYRLLANILTSYLAATTTNPTTAAAELGRSWGPSVVGHRTRGAVSKTQSITDLTDVLADLGFRPEPPAGPRATEIRLRHCPFYELVETHGEMICAVHLGLMQGALATMRAPVTVDHLDSFVEPDLCIAHLAPTSAADGASGKRRRPGGRPSSAPSRDRESS
jgi:predicted ArsR family transcriptional regulator